MSIKSLSLRVSRSTPTLKESALQKMRIAILTGYFRPSQRLVERSLCDELNVSRTVVREIIRYLEAEGLIENIPKKGPIVVPLDPDSVAQIYQMRLIIETKVGKECALHADDNTKKKLYKALQNIKNNYGSDDIVRLIESINTFYKIIFDSTQQNIAWDMVQRLNGKISRLRAITLSTKGRHVAGYQRMKSIYDGIKKNDLDKTEQAIRMHIEEASKIALDVLESKQEKQQIQKQVKGYWIADVTVTDPDKYQQYTAITPHIIQKYGGKFIVRGGKKHALEGHTNDRHVVLEFDSVEQALACYHSDEYTKACALRQQACIANVSIIAGE